MADSARWRGGCWGNWSAHVWWRCPQTISSSIPFDYMCANAPIFGGGGRYAATLCDKQREPTYSDQSHHLNNAGITVPLTLNQVFVGQRRNSSPQVHFASNKHSLGVKMTTELVRNSQWQLHWAVRRFAGPDININCEFVCRQYIDIS